MPPSTLEDNTFNVNLIFGLFSATHLRSLAKVELRRFCIRKFVDITAAAVSCNSNDYNIYVNNYLTLPSASGEALG